MRFRINRSPLKLDRRFVKFEALLLALVLIVTLATSRSQADTGTCSGQMITLPFTDVQGSGFFCFIAHLYFQGITLGTSPTTYGPNDNVRRDAMAAFLARTQNSTLQRGSRRAALKQFWTTTPQYTITAGSGMLGTTAVGNLPRQVAADGDDLWVVNTNDSSVSRVRAADGRLLETWTGVTPSPNGLVVAMGRVFVAADANPGRLYMIDPSQPAGAATLVANNLGSGSQGVAFDGEKIWTTNVDGSISLITPSTPPFTVNNVAGFNAPQGIFYDGTNIWVTSAGDGTLLKLDSNGTVLQTVTVGTSPGYPVYDGTNIWVPNRSSNSVTVVRPTDGMVLATLTGNGLSNPVFAAFDGQRIMITNRNGDALSLFRAADLAPLTFKSLNAGSNPVGVASDGINFWVALEGVNKLARF